MAKKTPSPPPPPDPAATAQAQTGSNVNTAVANAILGNANEISPYGKVTYKQIGSTRVGEPVTPASGGWGSIPGMNIPGGRGMPMGSAFGMGGLSGGGQQGYDIPQFERTVELSPEQQGLYNQQTKLGGQLNQLAIDQTGRLTDVLGQPISTAGLPERGKLPGSDFAEDRRRYEDAIYSRLEPSISRDRDALENKLVNQGLVRGTQAFNEAMDETNRAATDARMQAVLAGGGEQSRLFNMALQGGQAQDVQRERALQELLSMRNQPIAEVSSLMHGGSPTLPQFASYNAPNVAPTPVGDYVYNSAALKNQNYQTQMQQQNAAMGGLFGLGSAGILGASRYFRPV